MSLVNPRINFCRIRLKLVKAGVDNCLWHELESSSPLGVMEISVGGIG